MGFDLENFGIGLLAGWGSAYAVYRARGPIRRVIGIVGQGASSAQNSATQSSDVRYINDLTAYAERAHLGGQWVNLSRVLIEPRFIPAPVLPTPNDDETLMDIFRVIPQVHEHPFLYAPYNIDTLSINELATGSRHLALLGLPGSGRTTALLTIALHSLGRVKFTTLADKVQQKLDADEAAMSEKERAVRVRERILMEQRAKERFASEQGITFDEETNEELKSGLPLFNRLMPVYARLEDILSATAEFEGEVDPAEPLVRAVQALLGRVAASTVPRSLYRRLNRGEVLLLIDDFDDLPAGDQAHARAWLNAFLAQYESNFVIVAGPALGHGALTQIGLTPVFLRPWSDMDIEHAADLWADAWPEVSRRRARHRPDEEALTRAKANTRALTPFELVHKFWASFGGQVDQPGIGGWVQVGIKRLLPADALHDTVMKVLGPLGALQLDEGYLSSARMQARHIAGDSEPVTEDDEAAAGASQKAAKEEDTSAQGRLLKRLARSGLLVERRGGRCVFRHRLYAAYAASQTLHEESTAGILSRLHQGSWREAVAFAAAHMPFDDIVQQRLEAAPDLLYQQLTELARWVAHAPPDASWRGEVLRRLGTLVTNPRGYDFVRERAASALIETRDKDIALVFRRAVRSANPRIRALGCLGLGAACAVEGARDLIPLLQDQDPDVQLAAGMALGAVGSEDGISAMVEAFTMGSEPLRQAMAEAFAALPEEGYPILYDAINHDDMLIRRAAIFGLRRIRATWALIAIYRAFLEDEQWYVRSAAQQAFSDIQYGREPQTYPLPTPDRIPWLREWATERGETMPAGDGALNMLLRALQEGDVQVRAVAARTLGLLNQAHSAKALYQGLRDRQEDVRAEAHRALGALQIAIGKPLPLPA